MFKRRRYRPRKGPLPFRYVLLISFIIFFIMTVQGLWLVEKGIRPALLDIANTETQRIATLAINEAVSKKVLENSEIEKLIDIQKDTTGKAIVNFNPIIFGRFIQVTTLNVEKYLNNIAKGKVKDLTIPDGIVVEQGEDNLNTQGIIHMIPLGQATNNSLLAHLGPKVPVRLTAIGHVNTQLQQEVIEVGINNTWISLSVEITVDVDVVIPFATDTVPVQTKIPVGMIYIEGNVPEFYNAGSNDENMPMPAIIKEADINEIIDKN